MSNTIAVGPSYFNRFASGQGEVASSAYFTYSPDLDQTLTTILNQLNVHTAEINNVQGPGSTLPLDILQMDDLTYRAVKLDDGLIGIDSFFPTIQTAPNDNRIDVKIGAALAAGLKVSSAAAAVLTATDQVGSETDERFLSITSQGNALLSHLPDQGIFDAWHFDFATPSEVLSNPTRLAHVLQDGDDWEQIRRRRGSRPFFEGVDALQFNDNGGSPDTITRTVGSFIDDGFGVAQWVQVNESALNDDAGPYQITIVTATILTFATGSFVDEGPSTEIRLTAGHYLFHDFDQVHHRIEQIEEIIAGLEPDGLLVAFPFGTANNPSIFMTTAAASDIWTGFWHISSGKWGFTSGTAHQFSIGDEQMVALDGTAALPFYSFLDNPDMGMWRIGADRLGLVCQETTYLELDENGNVDLPTNARVKGVRSAALSVADVTATIVSFTAADAWDIGNLSSNVWHDHTAGATADQDFTVPTGADGTYAITANWDWAAPANLVRFTMEILVGGTPVAVSRLSTDAQWTDSLSVDVVLAAANVVTFRVTQDDTVGAANLNLSSCSLSIRKVA